MSTIQIVGIAVAAVIVLLLVIALIVTRKPHAEEAPEDEAAAAGASARASFLDAPPSDTLERLGKPEHIPEEEPPAGAAAVEATAEATAGAATAGAATAEAGEGLGLDWDHGDEARSREAAAGTQTSTPDAATPPAGEAETTDEMPAVEAVADGESPKGTLVPLSSIIVTTSTKMVDLEDPEVRRMLTELVTFEIDQATQYREQGQTVDAVLQLTEAEKICRALGKLDTAREIRDMMRGLQA